MLITNREKEIIKVGLDDYKFIKNFINCLKLKNLSDAKEVLNRFKDVDIYNINDDYLDFYYKDLSLCISNDDNKIKLCDCISIYDREKEDYIFEFNSLDYIESEMNKDKYDAIITALARIRDNETNGYSVDYYKKRLLNFIEQML